MGAIFGGGGSSSKAPPVPAVLPPAPPQPKPASAKVKKAGKDQRSKARAALGRQSTILTSGQGLLTDASTSRKTLLGV